MFCIASFSLAMCICCNETIYLITILYLVWKSDQRIVWKCEYLQKLVELVFGVKGCTWITHSHVISKLKHVPSSEFCLTFIWLVSVFVQNPKLLDQKEVSIVWIWAKLDDWFAAQGNIPYCLLHIRHLKKDLSLHN